MEEAQRHKDEEEIVSPGLPTENSEETCFFCVRRESGLRDEGRGGPQSQIDWNERSMVLDCDILKRKFSRRALVKV